MCKRGRVKTLHIHIGLIDALITFAYVLIVGVFWRVAAIHLKDTQLGQAMGFAY